MYILSYVGYWNEPGMGNVKANTFWEAELPQTYKRPGEKDHTGLENFIRAKYEAKRWVKRTATSCLSQERRLSPQEDVRARRVSQEDRLNNHTRASQEERANSHTLPEPVRIRYNASPNGAAEHSSPRGDHSCSITVEATTTPLRVRYKSPFLLYVVFESLIMVVDKWWSFLSMNLWLSCTCPGNFSINTLCD
jgi:hypothetical protein